MSRASLVGLLLGALAVAACGGSDPAAPAEPPPTPAERCVIDGGRWVAAHSSTVFEVQTAAGPVQVEVFNDSDRAACLYPPVVVPL